MSNRTGWVLPWIYDGVSIWVENGKLTNRWNPDTHEHRWRQVQNLIDFHEHALQLIASHEYHSAVMVEQLLPMSGSAMTIGMKEPAND